MTLLHGSNKYIDLAERDKPCLKDAVILAMRVYSSVQSIMMWFYGNFSEKEQWWWDFDGDDISGGLRMDLTFFGGERICDEENLSGSGPVCFASCGYIITTNTIIIIIIILNIIITFKVTLVEPISTGPQWRSWPITENLTQTSWHGAGITVGGDEELYMVEVM